MNFVLKLKLKSNTIFFEVLISSAGYDKSSLQKYSLVHCEDKYFNNCCKLVILTKRQLSGKDANGPSRKEFLQYPTSEPLQQEAFAYTGKLEANYTANRNAFVLRTALVDRAFQTLVLVVLRNRL